MLERYPIRTMRTSALLLLFCLLGASAFPASNSSIRVERGAPDMRWPAQMWSLDQKISWKFAGSFDATSTEYIRAAFKFWTDNSCLTYQENGPQTSQPTIDVITDWQCSSYVGRSYGDASQDLTLSDDCKSYGTVVHEIAHSMGIQHTMKRFDRDDNIFVNYTNMLASRKNSYLKLTEKENNNFGILYDFSSVMHYGPQASTANNLNTMTTLDPLQQNSLGQNARAAFSDIKMVNLYYKCAQKCTSPSVKCQNEGIINSKTCNTCICPWGFTGADCSQRHPGRGPYASKPGCGADLTASTSWQSVQGSIGEANKGYLETECYWNIKAPTGRKIEVRLNKGDLTCEAGCYKHGVEVFTRGVVYGGYKLCCMNEISGRIFRSPDNIMPVRLYSLYGKPVMSVDYRYV